MKTTIAQRGAIIALAGLGFNQAVAFSPERSPQEAPNGQLIVNQKDQGIGHSG